MRVHSFILAILLLACAALAWEDADYEIFDIVSELEKWEGKETSFYSWLGVQSSATTNEISKAYRKKSIAMHPDKNPGVKDIQKKFARLGVVAQILRNEEGRKRYDFFYKNGVPTWRGTGYYYSRYRPGLFSVLIFLVLLTSGLQYMVQRINRKKDLQRIQKIVASARLAAWGPKLTPLSGARKVKVNLAGGYNTGTEDDDYVPSKSVNMLVEGDHVYLAEGGELTLLDESAATQASMSNTWFLALARHFIGRVIGAKQQVETGEVEGSDDPTSGASSSDESPSPPSRSGTGTPVNGTSATGRPTATSMAGGRRRKGTNKKR